MRPGQFPILVPVVLLLSGLCILNQEVSSIGHLQEEASGALKGNFMVGGGEIGVDDDDYELPIDEQIPVATNEYRMGIPGSPQYDPEAPTIVVQLGGNTFNNIAHVARGMGLSLWMEREYGVKASLVLKRQKVAVAREAERDVKQCFPFMRSFDFGAATTPEMEQAIEQQRSDPIMKEVERVTNLVNNRTIPLLKKKLPVFLETYNKRHPRTEKHNRIGQVNLPFIYAWRLTCSGPLMDKYYDDFRNIFQFDHDNNDCCSGGPAADETVFHFRNYQTEMSGRNSESGFVELDAERVANDLLGHLKAGDKVAIVSRYATGVDSFINALTARGIRVRLVTGQSGMQDFCFLLKARKEIVGTTRSSFFMYAGFLGQAQTVRAYLASAKNSTWGDLYEWSHPDLQRRFRYHSYLLEA